MKLTGSNPVLAVQDLDRSAAYARALAEQADVLEPPTDERWGRREMALRSPDGHRFMLGQPRNG